MKTTELNGVKIVAILCILTCISDLIIVFVLRNHYAGYSQLKDTMSMLGTNISPVSNIISIWQICVGIVFICFGIVFGKTFNDNSAAIKLGSVLIILYGWGEGIGSGLFESNRVEGTMTDSFMMHSLTGGIGVIAALALPFILRKVVVTQRKSQFHIFSWAVFLLGLLATILFTFRFSSDQNNFIALYKGLWQRLFLLNLYVYFIVLSVIMYSKDE